ncbi:MAG: SDR family oxidoreductase [Chloroflexi bacterium]|nr:SDR family oxidoreductase [Chloroflexota bacterium]
MLDLFKLDGKVALVTGASRGIGKAIALALAAAGSDVAVQAHEPPEATAEEIRQMGRRSLALGLDLAQAKVADLEQLLSEVERVLGPLDILVNNAGTTFRGNALDLPEEEWDRVIQVNLKAAFFLSKAAGRRFAPRRRGKVILITSLSAHQGGLNIHPYAASKSALRGLTRTLSLEWAPFGINVNAIAPGYIATDLNKALRANPERFQEISGRIPTGRWGTPDDMQGVAVFLASAASDYVNGTTVVVDGGYLAR